jgi:hypothetical protein
VSTRRNCRRVCSLVFTNADCGDAIANAGAHTLNGHTNVRQTPHATSADCGRAHHQTQCRPTALAPQPSPKGLPLSTLQSQQRFSSSGAFLRSCPLRLRNVAAVGWFRAAESGQRLAAPSSSATFIFPCCTGRHGQVVPPPASSNPFEHQAVTLPAATAARARSRCDRSAGGYQSRLGVELSREEHQLSSATVDGFTCVRRFIGCRIVLWRRPSEADPHGESTRPAPSVDPVPGGASYDDAVWRFWPLRNCCCTCRLCGLVELPQLLALACVTQAALRHLVRSIRSPDAPEASFATSAWGGRPTYTQQLCIAVRLG